MNNYSTTATMSLDFKQILLTHLSQEQLESDCKKAFRHGNKQNAMELLPQIQQPADIRTACTFNVPGEWYETTVSLLHLAATHGWMDIVIDLTTKYKCDTNCMDTRGHTPLHYAARNNHLEVVRYFISEQHCDPMTRDNDVNTLLHIACDYNHIHIVKYLLSTGKVDPLAKNYYGKTPMFKGLPMLHLAATHGWVDIVIDLITKYKCDSNCKDTHGRTLLHYAANNNHLEVVRYFISEQHCDPMTRDNYGNTLLHIACDFIHTHIVKYLLSTGKVDPLAKNNYGKTPMFKGLPMLHLAAAHGWVDIIIDLITKYKCDTNCKDTHGCTPLHYAANNNRLKVVRYFISEQHCDPMTRDNYGNTLLHIACDFNHTHIVKYLLSTGKVDPLAKNNYGKTPMFKGLPMLHLAATHGWVDIVIDLITKYKCDTNCKDTHGRTPLHYAANNNHLEVVRYFISEQHCDPMTRDNYGNTLLHIACDFIHTHIVKYLLSTGKVDPLAKNNYGKTPMFKGLPMLHLAAAHGWVDIIIDLITKYKCDTNCKDTHGCTPLHYAANNNRLKVVRYFISEQHCDPMTRDNYGNTLLHIACDFIHTHIVKYLLSTGKVDPLAKNNYGKTPMFKGLPMLHLAATHGWVDIVIDLITKYKCDTNCKDTHGRTPLHYAANNNHLEVVRYFISEQHCDPMTRDNYGNTLLHIACDFNHTHIVKYLLSTGKVDPLAKNNYGKTPMFKGLPMLHLAATHGWVDIVIDLITKYKCDTNCKDTHGRTPLHYAANNNHLEVVRYFISEQHCDPMTRDNYGNTLLHIACDFIHTHIVKYLLSTGKVDPLAKNNYGKTPMFKGLPMLHLAATHGWVDIVIDLITKYKCDTNCKDTHGRTPLHYAANNNHLEVVRYFISEQHCDPMTRDNYGNTLLHIACDFIHTHIVKYLLSTGKVDPLAKNNYGKTPMFKGLPMLHLAATHGWVDIVIDLITKYKCDTNCKDTHGRTPLHYAANNNHLEVVRYFNSERHCDPMTTDNDGATPLHLACLYGNAHIVQCLLSTGKVDPLANNNDGETPVDYAHNNYDLLKQFQSISQCERNFPVHTYTKLVLTGYSGVGKTTISQLILLLANESGFFSKLSSGRVANVKHLTAGIIPLHVESKVKEVGNMVIYDFAGQQEYYSSHAAVLERILRNSAAIFVCIVDLSQCMDKISESIHYWISFMENACSSAQGSSQVIIVGSHADWVKSSQELKEKSSLVESIAESRLKQLTYGGYVSMDCRWSKTIEARHFRSLLSTSQQAILSSQPSMSLYCHVLYAFLCTKLGKTGCTLQELTSTLASEDFSPDSTVLTELLTSLSDKGLILFMQNQEHPQSSWVVVEKEALLRKVNGTLFAPNNFKQYRQVASNTGIVPIATLEELFPQYSSEMLVSCLESMEFCHPVDLSALQATNLKATLLSPPSGANHLFFPSLVKEHRPGNLPSPRFGWCLGCSDLHQFFSNRFLHVLLLRLAFTIPLASKKRSLSLSLHGLERQCEVWQNGICWTNDSGVSTIVEIVDLNRWVIVLVSEKTREAAETCSSVIGMILDLQHQLCSAVVTTCECLISPSLLGHYPFDALPDTDLFDLPTITKKMLLHRKFLLDRDKGTNKFSTDEALSCEPYYLLQPSSVCQLFNQSMASQPVPDPLLQEVLRYCQQPHQKPQDHKELREYINKHSIFAGRNPLVSSVQAVL